MSTVILTSKKNFVWSSMQEIIPFIVKSWEKADPDSVNVFDADEESFMQKKELFLKAENVVVSCFTPNIAKLISFLRFDLSLDIRLFVHVHNQASISFWPFRLWGRPDLFREQDVFISSCFRDADCVKNTFPEAKIEILPFSYSDLDQVQIPLRNPAEIVPFLFIGRLSSQKNLHTLLLSFSLLKKNFPGRPWNMTFIGSADGLGSPNMGFKDLDYDGYLKKLATSLGIEKEVTFKGLLPRGEIDQILNSKKFIFVSPSLHSDENFGMAAFRSLIHGHRAVLSDWGGHVDFQKYFPRQVNLVPVKNGLWLDPGELSASLGQAYLLYREEINSELSPSYLFKNITQQTALLLKHPWQPQQELPASPPSDALLERARTAVSLGGQNIFQSYSDPLSEPYFRSYGMQGYSRIGLGLNELILTPWTQESANFYDIHDPHRGSKKLEKNPISKEWLIENGYFYAN